MQIATRLATFQVRENERKIVKIITKLYFLSLEDSIILLVNTLSNCQHINPQLHLVFHCSPRRLHNAFNAFWPHTEIHSISWPQNCEGA